MFWFNAVEIYNELTSKIFILYFLLFLWMNIKDTKWLFISNTQPNRVNGYQLSLGSKVVAFVPEKKQGRRDSGPRDFGIPHLKDKL